MSTTDRRAAFLDGKLLQLRNKRAALDEELRTVSDKLWSIQGRFTSNNFYDSLVSAFRHRINRIPILMENVDREIREAEADIDAYRRWHPTS